MAESSEEEFESAISGTQPVNAGDEQNDGASFVSKSLVIVLSFLFYVYVVLSLIVFLIVPGSISPLYNHPITDNKGNSSEQVDNDGSEPMYIAKVLLRNSGLLLLFIFQHSFFPNHFVSQCLSFVNMSAFVRAVYVFGTCITLQFMAYFWTPILPKYHLWNCSYDSPVFYVAMAIVHTVCWSSICFSIFTFDYLELFGIRQIYYGCILGAPDPLLKKSKRTQDLWSHARHPVLLAPLIILWGVPFMSYNRFLVSVMAPAYLVWCNRVTDRDCTYVNTMFKKKKIVLLRGKED